MTPLLELKDIRRSYPAGDEQVEVLKGITLDIYAGEMVAIVGASGSGKSTLLRCINKLEEITSGDLIVDGLKVNDPKVDDRLIRQEAGMVFQQFYLFPHLTVFGNLLLAPRYHRLASDAELRQHACELLHKVGMLEHAWKYPHQLSGGQQQRVALARALILKPKVLLFDEPLSNLDANLRRSMRDKIRELQKQFDIPSLYVTHDQSEAFAVSDTVSSQFGPQLILSIRSPLISERGRAVGR